MSKKSFVLVCAFAIATTNLAQLRAQQPSAANAHSAHASAGGTTQTVGEHKIETEVMPKGVVFKVRDLQGNVVDTSSASGQLTLRIGDNPREFSYALKQLKNQAVGVAVDLAKVNGKTLHMDVMLEGIAATPIRFHAMGTLGGGLSDALLISLQKTCPVTGEKLGSMGAPPKIMIGDKPLFVCCAGCSTKVKSNSEEYVRKYYSAVGAEVRPGVLEATLADAAAIAAQKTCPVMDEELGGMGVPQKVNVNGKAVYICCVGCAKKLVAEADVYLEKLAKSGVVPPDFK